MRDREPSLSQPTLPRTSVRDEFLPPAADPFFYGWREVFQRVNGTEEWVWEPCPDYVVRCTELHVIPSSGKEL